MQSYRDIYNRLMQHSYRGVPGVLMVDSGRPGPTAAILACTHGNEPAGLGAIDYLLSDLQLSAGRLFCIVVNSDAAAAYFEVTTDCAREQARFVDYNMNRLPDDMTEWSGSVEGVRMAALLPILHEIDGGVLDIHSTSADAPAMLITVDTSGCEAAQCDSSPFSHVIRGITPYLAGAFVIEACERASLRLLAECGQHHCPEASDRAIDMSLAFLSYLHMIEPAHRPDYTFQKRCYQVEEAFRVPAGDSLFHLVKAIEPFEWIEKEQPLIRSDAGEEIGAPIEGYAIMCPETKGPLCTREALLFLCSCEE